MGTSAKSPWYLLRLTAFVKQVEGTSGTGIDLKHIGQEGIYGYVEMWFQTHTIHFSSVSSGVEMLSPHKDKRKVLKLVNIVHAHNGHLCGE